MRLKAFRLKEGKLEFIGIREVREGDAILDGDTGMEEVTMSESSKADDVNRDTLAGLSGKAKADFKRGLHRLKMADPEDRDNLRDAFKRLGLSDEQAEIAARGK